MKDGTHSAILGLWAPGEAVCQVLRSPKGPYAEAQMGRSLPAMQVSRSETAPPAARRAQQGPASSLRPVRSAGPRNQEKI